MSEIAKWGICLAAAMGFIGTILSFPILLYINVPVFQSSLDVILAYMGDALLFGRGLINNLLSPWARSAVSGLMMWLLGKQFMTYSLKIAVWAYKWIFK